MSSLYAKVNKAIKAQDWGAIETAFNQEVENEAIRLKDLKRLFPLLEGLEAETDEFVAPALEEFMYMWVRNLQQDTVETFFQYADHYVELLKTEDEWVKAGKAYEGLHIYSVEQAGVMIPEDKNADVFYIEAAESYLQGKSTRADTVMKKIRQSISRDQKELWIRYKACQSRLQDHSRYYGSAAYTYLSTLKDCEALEVPMKEEERIATLNLAATCAILDRHGPSRDSILASIKSEPIFHSLPTAFLVSKICNNEIVTPSDRKRFEGALEEHHKAEEADGRSLVEHAFIRHNVRVVSSIYKRVSLQTLTDVLGMKTEDEAETIITKMISKDGLKAIIDGVERNVEFNPNDSMPIGWESQISEFCQELEVLCEKIKGN